MPTIPDLPRKGGLADAIASLDEPYHEYWFHLGRFVHAYAQAEADLLILLREVSGLSKRRAGFLFNGTRSEEARTTINGFLEATDQLEKKKRLELSLSQMATIGTIRNDLVHWGATRDFIGSFVVSNVDRYPLMPK